MDTISYVHWGYGYSPYFVKNYKEIVNKIIANLHTQIKVVDGLNVICRASLNQVGKDRCVERGKVLQLDKVHMQVLGIKIGQILTWSEALKLIKKKMSVKKLEYTCEGCSWLVYV